MGSCLCRTSLSDEFSNNTLVLTLLPRFKGHIIATRKHLLVQALNLNKGVVWLLQSCLPLKSKISI